MRLNFEKFLNENGLKIGDRVKLSNGDIFEICQLELEGCPIRLGSLEWSDGKSNRDLALLGVCDFEKIEPKKKVGDLICRDMNCVKCPLNCLHCNGSSDTLREKLEEMLEKYPELETMKEYFEKELDKEIEEDE